MSIRLVPFFELPDTFLFVAYISVFGAAAFAAGAGAYRARTIADADTRWGLVALLGTSSAWAVMHVGMLLGARPEVQTAFYIGGLIVGAAAVGAWLSFCSAYTGRSLHRSPAVCRAFLVGFAIIVATKVTNPLHGLYFTTAPAGGPFAQFAVDHHALYWVSMGFSYTLAAMGYFMLFELFAQVESGATTLSVLAMLTGLPLLFNVVGYVSPWLLDISHEPIGVAAFAVGVLFVHRRRFQAVRLAGGQQDPALVVSPEGRVRDYNRSAAEHFPRLTERVVIGTRLQEALPAVADALDDGRPVFGFGQASRLRYYRLGTSAYGAGEAHPGRLLVLTEVTEQKEREQALENERSALRSMYRVAAQREVSLENKIRRLINLGREYLDLPYGALARVREDQCRIVHAPGTHTHLQPGQAHPLSDSYCRKTMQAERPLAVRDAVAEGWADDPAYDRFGFGAYLGSTVVVEGEPYGTFFFAGTAPRPDPFTEREEVFLELLTRWASYELEQRRNTARLERKNDELDRFARVVTHDLRNPLNVAKGRLDLALHGDDAAHLPAVDRALDRMDQTIQDVLALTHERHEGSVDERTAVRLDDAAEESWAHVDTANASLSVETSAELQAHDGRLHSLFENLFRNAVEHGGTDVHVRVGGLPDGFFVEDDGPGIPVEHREAVLTEGHSLHDGTGLGLSIVQAVVDAHEWTLTVAAGTEGGARFEVERIDSMTSGRETSPLGTGMKG